MDIVVKKELIEFLKAKISYAVLDFNSYREDIYNGALKEIKSIKED